MKLFTLSVLTFIAVGTAYSQEPGTVSGKTLNKAEKPKGEVKIVTGDNVVSPVDNTVDQQTYPVKVSSGTPRNNAQQSQPYKRTITDIDREIDAIEKKMDVVKNDPNEDAIAKKEGWYNKMNARLEYLHAERNKHLNKK